MLATTSSLLGGIGLFLLGMILMTDGLKGAAGSALQRTLAGLTRGPGQALAAGAGITALVQSSSATTLATIGFVSAGLLSFPQALGVVMGANLGTTSTGWIVALLGLKLRIGIVALPLVGVGALIRILASGRRAQLGLALAGFGLIFVGIDVLQEGMAGLAESLDPASFPSSGTARGGVLLVLGGALTTVAMQSSSAAVAATLTALHAGTVDLPQAAYLVVGQNVGTTVTAGLAVIGASVPARRTAVAHILFNLFTGAAALALLPSLLPRLLRAVAGFGAGDLTLVIAGFHTAFNVLGVVLLLPFIRPFARAVTRLIPEEGPDVTRHLDRSLTRIPAVAVEAARRALAELTARLDRSLAARLAALDEAPGREEEDPALDRALVEIRRFLGSVETSSEGAEEFEAHVAVLHVADHLDRLLEAAREPARLESAPEAAGAAESLAGALERAATWLEEGVDGGGGTRVAEMGRLSAGIAVLRRRQRTAVLDETARGVLEPSEADERLEAMRWVDRVAYHAWRSLLYLVPEAWEGGGEPVGRTEEARAGGREEGR